MKTKRVYTKKAETDGVGKRGAAVKEGLVHSLAYLELHGYCESVPDRVEVETETTGLSAPAAHGAVRRSRRLRP